MDPLFIAIEGVDGAGTTTCSKLLVQAMGNLDLPTMWTKEPSEGTVGRHIRKILKGQEAADELGMFPLFLADRHDHIASIVRPSLEQGTSVVCDRYAYSTWVYQQDNYDPFLIEYMQRACLAPDYVFVLLCPVEVCMKRLEGREIIERYEVEEKQRLYDKRYRRLPRLGEERIIHINTHDNGPEETVEIMLSAMRLPCG
jgi:dTMP kinase